MEAVDIYGPICLIPIAVVIVLSLITKKTFEPLLVAVFVAVIINSKTGFLGEFVGLLLKEMADPTIGWVFLVCGLMGALLMILEKSNAASSFAEVLGRYAKTRKRALFATWLMGLLLFIDDYLNVL
ncbi:MAG: sodium:proton antiporter, partial [Clostridiales Family XIII bacterium]|nr:sodium:proton antiporter [Clostridiales Family XIII bacterium]